MDSGKNVTFDAPPDHINVHVREGNILALQGEALTTQAALNTTFELLVVNSSNESTRGWIIDKVTVIGLEKVNGSEGFTLNISKGAELKGNTDVKANFHSNKRFVMVESIVSLLFEKNLSWS